MIGITVMTMVAILKFSGFIEIAPLLFKSLATMSIMFLNTTWSGHLESVLMYIVEYRNKSEAKRS